MNDIKLQDTQRESVVRLIFCALNAGFDFTLSGDDVYAMWRGRTGPGMAERLILESLKKRKTLVVNYLRIVENCAEQADCGIAGIWLNCSLFFGVNTFFQYKQVKFLN